MSNQNHYENQSPLNFIGYNNDRPQGMNQIKKKTEDFRKEIRREQLDKYFKAKRKLYFQTPHKKTLMDCLQAIQANLNVQENVCSLVNLLALKKPFEQYSSQNIQINQKVIEQFCTRMIRLLLIKTIPSFEKQPKCRIYCINAISNLFADELCPNVRYVQIVVQTIDARYGGLDIWDVDEEMIQVFYMISNLIRKNITQAKLLPIEKILAWAEGGVLQIPSDPLKCLTQGILQLFTNVDEMYNPKNHSLFTQHFSANRQIILQNFVKRFIQNANGDNLKKKGSLALDSENIFYIFKLFNKNKQYLLKIFYEMQNDQEDKKLRQRYINKIITIMNQANLKKDIVAEIGNFLVDLLQFYPDEPDEVDIDEPTHYYMEEEKQHLNTMIANFHQFLLRKEGLHMLFISLSQQNIDCKRVILKIVYELLTSVDVSLSTNQQQYIYKCYHWILVDNSLEVILTDLISDMGSRLKDLQMLKTMVEIYFQLIHKGNGRLGLKMRDALQKLLIEEVSFIDKDFCEYIDGILVMHKEKIDKNEI